MTIQPDQYELLDFGQGRKLERFGGVTLDRPCPSAADFRQATPELWREATVRFKLTGKDRGAWQIDSDLPDPWTLEHERSKLALRTTPFGHVGVFPEQADNWSWIAEQGAKATSPLKVLNLFAYTGGSTLAAAASGASVVHVDAAASTVAHARENAALSGLADAPVRWITDDVRKFVRREVRRGSSYDAIILDPPSYGHGPKGEVWSIQEDLETLLKMLAKLVVKRLAYIVLTCHTPGYEPSKLRQILANSITINSPGAIHSTQLRLTTAEGRPLRSGSCARWSSC